MGNGMNKEQSSYISDLHNKYASSMVQLTYRRIGDADLAKDLVQETFLIACYKSDLIYNHINPAGWLFSTLQKLTMREMKKAYQTEVYLDCDIPTGLEEPINSIELYMPKGLTDNEREIIQLRVDKELSFEEISNQKGISEVACRKQVSRAFKKCRELMSNSKCS